MIWGSASRTKTNPPPGYRLLQEGRREILVQGGSEDRLRHQGLLDPAGLWKKTPTPAHMMGRGEVLLIEGQALCQCVIDRDWLRIVFDNLFDNAVKYSSTPVKITIRLSCTEKYFIAEIKDCGVGISSNNQKTIFQKFQRIEHQGSPCDNWVRRLR